MKRKYLFIVKSLSLAFMFITLVGCDEKSIEVPFVEIAQVSKFERDSVKTIMNYNNDRLSNYDIYVCDSLVNEVIVRYSAGSISCVLNDVAYNIKLSNTRGAIRAESIDATTLSGARLYSVVYDYYIDGRLKMARLDGVDPKEPIFNNYRYEANTIIIDDAGTDYILELSSEKNLGNVCNVLDYANAPYTSKYIINPDLYFLNIYGVPVEQLPLGQTVSRCNNNKNLSRVGKYYYEYESYK